jgi:transcription-repair coupling factor (superfamily II helicase)
VLSEIRHHPVYKRLLEEISLGIQRQGLALPRPARLPVVAALCEDLKRPTLLLTDRSDRAQILLDELKYWAPGIRCLGFPEPAPMFYEQAAWGIKTRYDRLQVLASLASYHGPGKPQIERPSIFVSSVRSLMGKTLPRRDFLVSCSKLRIGMIAAPDVLVRKWVGVGYQRSDTVLEPGQISRRGGILDIWIPAESMPARIEFFGDEIETLRSFNPASQRTEMNLDHLLITPAREILSEKAESAMSSSQEDVREFYIPVAHPSPNSLLDYLPKQATVFMDDVSLLRTVALDIEEQAVKDRKENIAEGILADDYPVPYLSWSEIEDSMSRFSSLELGYSTAVETSEVAELFSTGKRFGGQLKLFIQFLGEKAKLGDHTVIVSRQSSRIHSLWTEKFQAGQFNSIPDFQEGTLSGGWVFSKADNANLHFLTDSEIFGWERPKPRRRVRPVAEAPETSYADIQPGDWVVHIDYGIGQFLGLVNRTLEGTECEYLCIEYKDGAELYVPIHQADRVNRYIGADNRPPTPSRLGSQEWTKAKNRASNSVKEVAQELLDIYAIRQVSQGHQYSLDQPWQQELEASFPYIETEDQIIAIRDVKLDMQGPRPMDRLLCGDVGYGKTEVALRAAFKAVMDGKQVAMLVPTTVLAQQHYDTFRKRLAVYPVELDMLSRFRTPKEQKRIIQRLREGRVDILIGTHRLLQQDVQFKELGLLIIDEEQRFGVSHKEYFKRMRSELDVLTLTATPIPRTLYMAITDIRDISTIDTPPEERLPIITHIGPYSQRLVRQAILRELDRGGQVFFVHNRVQTIRAMESHLSHLVPEAKIKVGHGQMHEGELEAVMREFREGEIDVLLCTSIIESGLDIPNANTLIVDRGDTFGLAQLYQLRGRVGRGAQRAYAYFFRHRKKPPTPEGQERLEIIAENTQLGAGYSIAMRDLEMRGAGELLGTRQHGYIASVGFQLYTRLLGQAVRDLKHQEDMPEHLPLKGRMKAYLLPVSVELPLSIGIPTEYVTEQEMRLRLYRRIADIEAEDEIPSLEEEFRDRFGPLPEMVRNLLFQVKVKLQAEEANLSAVIFESGQIILRVSQISDDSSARILPDIGFQARVGKNAYWLPWDEEEEKWKVRLLGALAAIYEHA